MLFPQRVEETRSNLRCSPSQIIISQDGIHAIGTRYQLLKGDRDKAVYRDLETGHKIEIEIDN